jgi:hypothetical protein
MKSLTIWLLAVVVTLMSGALYANFGSVTGGATPPGLRGKVSPSGLNMQNKTPYGWSQGEKKGWKQKNHFGKEHFHKHRVYKGHHIKHNKNINKY